MAASKSLTIRELTELIGAQARVIGDDSLPLSSVSEDSRKVQNGAIFVAKRGTHRDGGAFIGDARKAGAVCVLAEDDEPSYGEPRIVAPELAKAFAIAAHAFQDFPARDLRIVGITGTNGKTTTTSLVTQALAKLGVVAARIGTLGFFVGDELVFETLTTPGPVELARALAIAKSRGVTVCVMEVSSHALEQGRVLGVPFEVVAFTNLTQDHLDYHKTMEAYGASKARLFLEHEHKHAVIHAGDEYGRKLGTQVNGAFLVGAAGAGELALAASESVFSAAGFSTILSQGGVSVPFSCRLVGRHNLENILVAAGILRNMGYSLDEASRALAEVQSVPGRLERCDVVGDDLVVLVDYAHTPDALERVLVSLRDVSEAPIYTVFGCGGDRDRSKRAPMGRVATKHSTAVWVTSDNPRTEAQSQIFDDIRPGLESGPSIEEVFDRSQAIRAAVLAAPAGATVLIAGKGHETYQLINGATLPFDDRDEARRALGERRVRGTPSES